MGPTSACGTRQILRLSAAIATEEMGSSPRGPAGELPQSFAAFSGRIGFARRGIEALPAEEALAAGDGERNDHPIADLQAGRALATSTTLAHGFMARMSPISMDGMRPWKNMNVLIRKSHRR